MLDPRATAIEYQAQSNLMDLVESLIDNARLGKIKPHLWDEAFCALRYLDVAINKDILDSDQQNKLIMIYDCLLEILKINHLPGAPGNTDVDVPVINVGPAGPAGAPGAPGAQGATGLATDFQVANITTPTVVDFFAVSSAKAVRWDYVVTEVTGKQRGGSIIAHWNTIGSLIEFFDSSAEDITGSTDDLGFEVDFFGGNIRLRALPAAGNWTVVGSRYFIPNNGNGTGPVSDVLPNGTVFIGNVSNFAQSRTVSGVITITNTGVTSFVAGAIMNGDINASAAIALSKLATLTVDRALISSGAGIITVSAVTAVELGYVSGVTSSIQSQLNAKLTDPTTTVGDLIFRNGSNVIARLPIGSVNQVLTVVGGVPTWAAVPGGISGLTTDYIPKATSATTIGNSIMNQVGSAGIVIAGHLEAQTGIRTQTTGVYLKHIVVNIGVWNMDSTLSVNVATGVDVTKIRGVDIIIQDDSGNLLTSLFYDGNGTGTQYYTLNGVTDNIYIQRPNSGYYDSASYSSGAINRGWIYITYEA